MKTKNFCDVCGKQLSTPWKLKAHGMIHTGEKPYPCTSCNKTFRCISNLRSHDRIHTGEKPYRCRYCGKHFRDDAGNRNHERIHTGEKPYTCRYCGEHFRTSSTLSSHERIHTGEKPYTCKYCGQHFIQSSDLHRHERIHTGEKPYTCKYCGQHFRENSSLHRHERIHTGEKPYMCLICGKQFTTSTQLKVHSAIHTQEKQYFCKVCDKSYPYLSSLNYHYKTNHKEQLQCNRPKYLIDKELFDEDKQREKDVRSSGDKTYKHSVGRTKEIDLETNVTEEKQSLNENITEEFYNDSRIFTLKQSKNQLECSSHEIQSRSEIKVVSNLQKSLQIKVESEDCDFDENGVKSIESEIKVKPYNCDVCFRGYKRFTHLIHHLREHVIRP